MKNGSKKIGVSELARLSGVSVRTLHYYDELGLLEPSGRNASGYRYYEKGELLRLQQVLFFRELEMPLEQIRTLMENPDFDSKEALLNQRKMLLAKQLRLHTLIRTIDKTLETLQGGETMLSEEELFEGFNDEERKAYVEEASLRWPDTYKRTMNRLKKMTKEDFLSLKEEGEHLWHEAAQLMNLEPSDEKVMDLMARLYGHFNNFYNVTPEIFEGLGISYVQDDRFAGFYDKIALGLNRFLKEAMSAYAKKITGGK